MFSSSMQLSSSAYYSLIIAFLFERTINNYLVLMQFGNHGSLEQHGFARNRTWTVDPDPPPFATISHNKAFIDLILKPSEEDAKIWPHRCMTLFL